MHSMHPFVYKILFHVIMMMMMMMMVVVYTIIYQTCAVSQALS